MCRYLDFLANFRRLLDCGQSDLAIELAESMVNQCPDLVVYREHWAQALWDQERYGEVRRVLQQAQSLGLLSPYALLVLVHSSAALGHRKVALEQMRDFLSSEQSSRKDLATIARSFGELSEYRLALEVCFHLAKAYPNAASAWYGIGFYQDKLGLPAEATNDAFRKAILLSDCLCTRLRYAKNLSELGRSAEAYTIVRHIDFCSCCKGWQREVIYEIAHSVGDREMLCLLASLDKSRLVE